MKDINRTKLSRRDFMNKLAVSGLAISGMSLFGEQVLAAEKKDRIRRFHISIQQEAWIEHPELLSLMKNAGITDIWMGSYLQGKWFHSPEELQEAAMFLRNNGFNAHVATVPLGHPGNAIDLSDDSWAIKKNTWENACDFEGNLFSGTSIHPNVIKDNIEAHKILATKGFDLLFLDDDFRVAQTPGKIGGCFCDKCKNEFLQKYGYGPNDWGGLLESVENREPSKILRSWVEFICDKEYSMFVDLQEASAQMQVGIMVMYFGAEKAGIALEKYRDVPFRIGEMMFNDNDFGRVKGKTDELFSALFHMRFIRPELAYSETTAFPPDALSAKNMAAKLAVSLFADVRNTMFMSGATPFPIEYWDVLAPAMKKSAKIHEKLAGLKPSGPFKHFWGWDSRLVGKDKPFSLFLASGIPFEVVDEITDDGWVFLSEEDARSVAEGRVKAKAKNLVVQPNIKCKEESFIELDETLDDIFEFKKSVVPSLKDIPYVAGDTPVIFSWYPDKGKALLWNVNEDKRTFRVLLNDKIVCSVDIEGLDVAFISV